MRRRRREAVHAGRRRHVTAVVKHAGSRGKEGGKEPSALTSAVPSSCRVGTGCTGGRGRGCAPPAPVRFWFEGTPSRFTDRRLIDRSAPERDGVDNPFPPPNTTHPSIHPSLLPAIPRRVIAKRQEATRQKDVPRACASSSLREMRLCAAFPASSTRALASTLSHSSGDRRTSRAGGRALCAPQSKHAGEQSMRHCCVGIACVCTNSRERYRQPAWHVCGWNASIWGICAPCKRVSVGRGKCRLPRTLTRLAHAGAGCFLRP